jgi:hypothetical protein
VAAIGWAAIGAFVAGAAEAQAERSKANKLVAKNMFLVIDLAFMAIPLFLAELFIQIGRFRFLVSYVILLIGYSIWRKNT